MKRPISEFFKPASISSALKPIHLFGQTSNSGISRNDRFPVAQFTKFLSHLVNSQGNFEKALESVKATEGKIAPNQVLFSFNGIDLKEVRAGTSVARTSGSMQGKTRSGTIGLSGKNIGIAATSGSFSGKMNSTTITPPTPESLQNIDSGKIIVRKDVIAFVGSNYTKTIEYRDILDWVSSSTSNPFSNHLTISVKGLDKVVVFVFTLKSENDFLSGIIGEVTSSENQNLDSTLIKQFLTYVESYVVTRRQEIETLENLLENKVGIAEKWKNFALNGGDFNRA